MKGPHCLLLFVTLALGKEVEDSTDYTTSRYPTEYPTTWHPTEYPTTWYPTEYPTTRYPTEYPTTQYPTEYPTTWYTTEYPTSSPSPTESPHVCYEDGECLYSNLIDVTYPSSAEECLQHCRRTDRCQWFTFKTHGGSFCELFESCEYLSDNECTNCVTGQVTCPDQQCNILGRCEVIFKSLIQHFITYKLFLYILGTTFTFNDVNKCRKMSPILFRLS